MKKSAAMAAPSLIHLYTTPKGRRRNEKAGPKYKKQIISYPEVRLMYHNSNAVFNTFELCLVGSLNQTLMQSVT